MSTTAIIHSMELPFESGLEAETLLGSELVELSLNGFLAVAEALLNDPDQLVDGSFGAQQITG
jgi:hypothetical protein